MKEIRPVRRVLQEVEVVANTERYGKTQRQPGP